MILCPKKMDMLNFLVRYNFMVNQSDIYLTLTLRNFMNTLIKSIAALFVATMLLSACGAKDKEAAAPTEAAAPVEAAPAAPEAVKEEPGGWVPPAAEAAPAEAAPTEAPSVEAAPAEAAK
ncbi:MAG: hypothetical protein ACKVN9_00835 [Methylophilaceae bacterium]